MKPFFQVLAGLVAAIVVVATAMPMLEGRAWWIRVFDFPRIQTLVLALLATPSLFVAFKGHTRLRWAGTLVLCACATLQSIEVLPHTPLVPVAG